MKYIAMNELFALIEEKQKNIVQHPFFDVVTITPVDRFFKAMSMNLTLWVCVFQDFLDIIPNDIHTASLKKIALHHRHEDKGHHHWFFDDLQKRNISSPPLNHLFSDDNHTSRFLIYKIIGIYHSITDDYLRVLFLTGLETVGHVFFEKMSHYIETLKLTHQLTYFSESHLAAEKNHQLYENELQEYLKTYRLSAMQIQQGRIMLENLFAAFDALFNEMAHTMSTEHATCSL